MAHLSGGSLAPGKWGEEGGSVGREEARDGSTQLQTPEHTLQISAQAGRQRLGKLLETDGHKKKKKLFDISL